MENNKHKWIGFKTDKSFDESDRYQLHGSAAPYFRKKFVLGKKLKKAILSISSLGIFKTFINGKDVSDEYFAPGWTNYRKRIIEKKYDVTALLSKENAICVILGDGWYVGYLCIMGRDCFGNYPLSFFAQLDVLYEDGTAERIVSDESWKAGTGAIRENDFLFGEIFDSRLPHKEISEYEFDDSSWQNALISENKDALLCEIAYEPVRLSEMLIPEYVSDKCGKTIYDFKQNFAGLVNLKCRGENGAVIHVRHGEMLHDDGTLYTENLRIAKAEDVITLNGKELDYIPTFTYHGFRYIEITVIGKAEIISITGRALHNDLKVTGTFSTSNELVNKLYSNIWWGQNSNFIDLPTDCPQRNERLGWSGDVQVFSRTAMYNCNSKNFFEKHMYCVEDDTVDGRVPDVIPYIGELVGSFDSSGWRDVSVVLPFNLWEMYGDKNQALKYVPLIKSFLNLQIKTSDNYIWQECFYNDWLNVEEDAEPSVLATLCNAYSFTLAINLFEGVGEDCGIYKDFLANVKTEFHKKFVNPDNSIAGATQSVYALAYRTGFSDKNSVAKYLKEKFTIWNDHIHSGFVGIRFILPVLCDIGLSDLAYKLITNKTYPSWGYSIENGATTIWERWNSWTKEKGFADLTMNSFNHYSFGSCGEWFYEYVLGIKPKKAGFEEIVIRPYVDRSGKITSAKGSYDSVKGKISVSWRKEENCFRCDIEKPETLKTEFVFDNIIKIICDGIECQSFNDNASYITVFFA